MPIREAITDHPITGPQIRRGIEQGREQGMELGERKIIRNFLTARLGELPARALERLDLFTGPKLESIPALLPRASSIEEIFG